MTNNYPPGMGRRDKIRAGIIEPHAHEHEWWPDEHNGPLIEDGAAIFTQVCEYSEGEFGEKWSCDETRTYRFEYSTLETPDGDKYDLPTINKWDEIDSDEIAEKVVRIEEQHCYVGPGDEETTMKVDPDPDCGFVSIEWNGYTLYYRPE